MHLPPVENEKVKDLNLMQHIAH